MFTAKTVDSAISALNKALESLKQVRTFQDGEIQRLTEELVVANDQHDRADRIIGKLSTILE